MTPEFSSDSSIAWLAVARSELGVAPGGIGQSNPRIEAYHATVSNKGWDDRVAWCSSFVNWCLLTVGIQGTNSALARSWLEWGNPLVTPRRGCITVLAREEPQGWRGHVGFFMREEAGLIYLLGGNQLGEVREHAYEVATLLGHRWPVGD